MKDVFVKLGTDFLSTLVFLGLYLTTGNLALATGVAIAGAVAFALPVAFRRKGDQMRLGHDGP